MSEDERKQLAQAARQIARVAKDHRSTAYVQFMALYEAFTPLSAVMRELHDTAQHDLRSGKV